MKHTIFLSFGLFQTHQFLQVCNEVPERQNKYFLSNLKYDIQLNGANIKLKYTY